MYVQLWVTYVTIWFKLCIKYCFVYVCLSLLLLSDSVTFYAFMCTSKYTYTFLGLNFLNTPHCLLNMYRVLELYCTQSFTRQAISPVKYKDGWRERLFPLICVECSKSGTWKTAYTRLGTTAFDFCVAVMIPWKKRQKWNELHLSTCK